MWSRNPTPVETRSLAGAVEREPRRDLGLLGRALDLGRAWWCGGGHQALAAPTAAPELPASLWRDSACTGNPSARATLPTCGASARAADSGNDTNACLRRNVAAPSGPEKRAAPPVGSTWLEPGDVVAEGGAAAADEHAAAGAHRARPAVGASAQASSRCSGANRVGERRSPRRGLGARTSASGASWTRSAARAATSAACARDRVQQLARSGLTTATMLSGPCSACAARSSATSARVGRRVGHDHAARWARRCRRCRPARRAWRLASCT